MSDPDARPDAHLDAQWAQFASAREFEATRVPLYLLEWLDSTRTTGWLMLAGVPGLVLVFLMPLAAPFVYVVGAVLSVRLANKIGSWVRYLRGSDFRQGLPTSWDVRSDVLLAATTATPLGSLATAFTVQAAYSEMTPGPTPEWRRCAHRCQIGALLAVLGSLLSLFAVVYLVVDSWAVLDSSANPDAAAWGLVGLVWWVAGITLLTAALNGTITLVTLAAVRRAL